MTASLAILVTGEVRTSTVLFDSLAAQSSADGQILFSLWRQIGSKLGGWMGPRQVSRVLGDAIGTALPPSMIGFGHLERVLPDFFHAFRADLGSRTVDPERLAEITSYFDIEDRRLFVEVIAKPFRQYTARFIHYKFSRGLALLQIAEAEHQVRYEHIVRVRPDLGDLPQWPAECGDNDMFVDWFSRDEASGKLLVGDNIILAKRAVMLDLADYMRAAIYDLAEYDIHVILGGFITSRGLSPRTIATSIADDPWPREAFLDALRREVDASPDDATASAFLACVDANCLREIGDLAGATAALDRLGEAGSAPVLLARGRIALAAGDPGAAMRAVQTLRSLHNPNDLVDQDFYRQRLEALYARAEPESRKDRDP